jgi:hypothetical protein
MENPGAVLDVTFDCGPALLEGRAARSDRLLLVAQRFSTYLAAASCRRAASRFASRCYTAA